MFVVACVVSGMLRAGGREDRVRELGCACLPLRREKSAVHASQWDCVCCIKKDRSQNLTHL